MKSKKIIIMIWLLTALATTICIFWQQQFVYSLPTPVPANYTFVAPGTKIKLPVVLNTKVKQPVFLHFFNPDCPCSKFNITHFKSLVNKYADRVLFAIVVVNKKDYTEEQIKNKLSLDIPVLFDTAIAARFGVYSTPQAVIMDCNQKLFYRGNYNRTRYCTDTKTNYAQQALNSLLSNKRDVVFNQFALRAYGCPLPKCLNGRK